MDRYRKNCIQTTQLAINWSINGVFFQCFVLASLVTICLPIGSFIAGPLMDKFGRRSVALFTCIPFIIGWILMYFATDVRLIYMARVIAGIGAGLYTLIQFLIMKFFWFLMPEAVHCQCKSSNSAWTTYQKKNQLVTVFP